MPSANPEGPRRYDYSSHAATHPDRRRNLIAAAIALVASFAALHLLSVLLLNVWPGATLEIGMFMGAVAIACVAHRLAIDTRRNEYIDQLVGQIDAMTSATIVEITDAQGRIVDANEMFCRLSGYSRDELIGQTHRISSSGWHTRKFFADMYCTLSMGQIWRGEICNAAKDGSQYWVDTTIVPTRDAEERITRYTSVRVDITARKNAEQRSKWLTAQQKQIADGLGICTWNWNLVTDSVSVEGPWQKMLGCEGNSQWAIPPDPLRKFIVAEDLLKFRAALDDHCRHATSHFECKVRMQHHDERHIWVQIRGRVGERDSNGLALGVSGQFMDITAVHEANDRIEQSQSLLKTIIDVLPHRIYWKDRDGRFLGANRAVRSDAGDIEMIGKTDYDMPWREQASAYLEDDRKVMASRSPIMNRIESQTRPDGTVSWLTTSKVPLIDVHGDVWGTAGTYSDITSIKGIEAELIRTRDVAESASRAKSDFLSVMSHEIRTPMNAVIGFTDFLFDTKLDDEQRGFVTTIRESGRSLLTIIDDILDFSRIEAGGVALSRESFDARRVADEVVNLLKPKAVEKQIHLALEWSALHTCLIGDVGRFRQVLINLLSNALKFTANGSIRVRTVPQAGALRIEVIDTGIGIASENLAKLFTRFTQADSSTTRKFGGTGLGLAISKQLMGLMGGTIGVKSEPGLGSTFWLVLPYAPSVAAEAPVAPVAALGRSDDWSRYSGHAHVLVVEDNAVNSLVAKRMLSKLGCTVDLATDGHAANAQARKTQYDAIFMDCQMPELDGFGATRAIREFELTTGGRTPIIALSANVLPEDKRMCTEAGMDDHVAKPIALEELQRVLMKWCPQGMPPLRRKA